MSRELQPPVPISLVKIEHPTVIKNEPPQSEIVEIGIDDILNSSESEEEIIADVKGIDIVFHPVCDEAIKSEILESKYCESLETRVLVKAENYPFVQTENITQRIKTEDTSDENVNKGTGQAVVEIQGSHEHSNELSNLETHGQLVLNSSNGTTSWEKEKDKIKIIRARYIPVESHEYTSLAEDKHVCKHCLRAYNTLKSLKNHIRKMHRKVTTMYQCPYCSYKSKWTVQSHIIQIHKDTKDIQWFPCHLCELKFKLKRSLTRHMKVHLKHKQMQDGLDLREKGYVCDKCNYKTDRITSLKIHKLTHLKPEEIQYFYCYHCSYKSKQKIYLKNHIFKHHVKNLAQGKRHHCNMCDYETYRIRDLQRHKLIHLRSEEVQYFYCYHCSVKVKRKWDLKNHIFRHFKKEQVKFDCYICNFMTPNRKSIIKHIKKHSKVQNKSEINE